MPNKQSRVARFVTRSTIRRMRYQLRQRRRRPHRKPLLVHLAHGIWFLVKCWIYFIGLLLVSIEWALRLLYRFIAWITLRLIYTYQYKHVPTAKHSTCTYWVEELNELPEFQFMLDRQPYRFKGAHVASMKYLHCIQLNVETYIYGGWTRTLLVVSPAIAANLVVKYRP